jgi:hypothetical protein
VGLFSISETKKKKLLDAYNDLYIRSMGHAWNYKEILISQFVQIIIAASTMKFLVNVLKQTLVAASLSNLGRNLTPILSTVSVSVRNVLARRSLGRPDPKSASPISTRPGFWLLSVVYSARAPCHCCRGSGRGPAARRRRRPSAAPWRRACSPGTTSENRSRRRLPAPWPSPTPSGGCAAETCLLVRRPHVRATGPACFALGSAWAGPRTRNGCCSCRPACRRRRGRSRRWPRSPGPCTATCSHAL